MSASQTRKSQTTSSLPENKARRPGETKRVRTAHHPHHALFSDPLRAESGHLCFILLPSLTLPNLLLLMEEERNTENQVSLSTFAGFWPLQSVSDCMELWSVPNCLVNQLDRKRKIRTLSISKN